MLLEKKIAQKAIRLYLARVGLTVDTVEETEVLERVVNEIGRGSTTNKITVSWTRIKDDAGNVETCRKFFDDRTAAEQFARGLSPSYAWDVSIRSV